LVVHGQLAVVDHALPLGVAFLNELEGGLEEPADLRFGVAVGTDVDLARPRMTKCMLSCPLAPILQR
jgi:hypothetical protein